MVWLMHHWSWQSNRKPDLCNMHDKRTSGEKSWDLLVRVWSWFWALPCAQVLPPPSDRSRNNVQLTCPPGHWLGLLARARWPVLITMAPVPSLMPLVDMGWHQDERVCRGHLGGQKPSPLHPTLNLCQFSHGRGENEPMIFIYGRVFP